MNRLWNHMEVFTASVSHPYLFLERSFYVASKRTAARHNKWTDGAIREGFVDSVRSSKDLHMLIALFDLPLPFCLWAN